MTRLREHGLRIGELEPGERNAITDVPGVAVGHVTTWRDEDEPPAGRGVARTGVTVILPGSPGGFFEERLPAGVAALNAVGEMTGFIQTGECGLIETPVYLTSTMAVGRIFDGAVAAAVAANPRVGVDRVVIPIVAECDDSWLNNASIVQVEAEDAGRAIAASGPDVDEGCVGAGTGMIALGWKAGIGTSSRVVPESGATLGVLVLANFGAGRDLRIDGVRVGQLLGDVGVDFELPPAGSCIAVVATDAPLPAAQLERVARRAGLGLARTGSVGHDGSGEIFLAFSTNPRPQHDVERLLDPLFSATVEATEEAVLNALWAATDTTGRDGRLVRALPHDDVLELLATAGRLSV